MTSNIMLQNGSSGPSNLDSYYLRLDGSNTMDNGASVGWDANTGVYGDVGHAAGSNNLHLVATDGKLYIDLEDSAVITFEGIATPDQAGIVSTMTNPSGDNWYFANNIMPYTKNRSIGCPDYSWMALYLGNTGGSDIGGSLWIRSGLTPGALYLYADNAKAWFGAGGTNDYDIYFDGTDGLLGVTRSKNTKMYSVQVTSMNSAGFVKNDASGNLTGGNSIDISADTNLGVTSPIVLTGDTLSFDYGTTNTWTGINTFQADLYVAAIIGHEGDADTYLSFAANNFNIYIAGSRMFDLTESKGVFTINATATYFNVDSQFAVGEDEAGHDVNFYGDTVDKFWSWDASEDRMLVEGESLFNGIVTVGSDGTGYDVTLYSGTFGAEALWDASEIRWDIDGRMSLTRMPSGTDEDDATLYVNVGQIFPSGSSFVWFGADSALGNPSPYMIVGGDNQGVDFYKQVRMSNDYDGIGSDTALLKMYKYTDGSTNAKGMDVTLDCDSTSAAYTGVGQGAFNAHLDLTGNNNWTATNLNSGNRAGRMDCDLKGNGTATIAGVLTLRARVQTGTGTFTTCYSLNLEPMVSTTGTITEGNGIRSLYPDAYNGTFTLFAHHKMFMGASEFSGTGTTQYGLYFTDKSSSTWTTNYDIYTDEDLEIYSASGDIKLNCNGGYAVLQSSKSTTGDPTGSEGMIYINTNDNVINMYADGAWRTLASW